MTNEDSHKEELKEWLNSLLIVNKSRFDEIKFIEKQLRHRKDEIIHLKKQIKFTNDLIGGANKEINK